MIVNLRAAIGVLRKAGWPTITFVFLFTGAVLARDSRKPLVQRARRTTPVVATTSVPSRALLHAK
jgi:hypothetical protein